MENANGVLDESARRMVAGGELQRRMPRDAPNATLVHGGARPHHAGDRLPHHRTGGHYRSN
eukprot:5129612-Prorocentrum_lima.AAC.1